MTRRILVVAALYGLGTVVNRTVTDVEVGASEARRLKEAIKAYEAAPQPCRADKHRKSKGERKRERRWRNTR